MSLKTVKIGNFLNRVKQAVEIQNSIEYKRITIKTKHQGIFLRDALKGSLIGTKLQFVVTKGQFILSKIDARLGAFGIVPEELDGAIITGNFWVFDVDETQINIDWFNLFTSSGNFYDICNQASSGTTHRKYLDEDKFLNFEIDLPELYEQHAFMNQYETYYVSYKSVQSEIDQQQTYLQLLRQTILQEAVQGKLTKQDQTDEPATELLKRIRAEKEKLIKAGKLKREKELPPIKEDEIPFELPEGWVWCRLQHLADLVTSGSRDWAQYYSKSGAKFIRMGNLTKDSFNLRLDSIQYVSPPKDGEGNRTRLEENDILISVTGDVGMLGLIPANFGEAYINQHTALVRLNKNVVTLYFANLFLAPVSKKHFNAPQRGIKNSFRLTDITEMLIPLPPLAEQQRIVAKVQQLQQQLSQLEAQVQQSRQYAQQLLRSVLREAFEQKGKVYEIEDVIMVAEG